MNEKEFPIAMGIRKKIGLDLKAQPINICDRAYQVSEGLAPT